MFKLFPGRTIGVFSAVLVVTLGTAHAVPLHGTPGNMQDLDIGADGDVFAIGTENIAGTNGRIYQWIKGGWQEFGGYGTRVAVDPDGNPWIINGLNEIWRYGGSSWAKIPGSARAIDIGPDNSVFIIHTDGYVYKFNGSSFVHYGGYGVEITVDEDNYPWVVNGLGEVWRNQGATWSRLSGTARDIDAGATGTVYKLTGGSGANGYIYRWNGAGWTYNGDYGTRIAVSPTGTPNIVNSANAVRGSFVKRMHGDTSCHPTERDCNVCAPDVKAQLDNLFLYERNDRIDEKWHLWWLSLYAPDALVPAIVFDDADAKGHVQGFAKTGHPSYPFVGSYSDKDDGIGSVFVIQRSTSGSLSMSYLHQAAFSEWHPSGVHALGHHAVVNEKDRLKILDLDSPFGAPAVWDPNALPEVDGLSGRRRMSSSGGGLGIVRLDNGKALIASTNPGSNGPGDRTTYFWTIQGSLLTGDARNQMQYIGGGSHVRPDAWGDNYRSSENMSLVTECETGQIYAIHVTGDSLIFSTGHWRLDRLEQGPSGPVLRGIAVYNDWQDWNSCYLRAAGTAYANDSGIIDVYCHEYDARREAYQSDEWVNFVTRRGRSLP